VWSHRSIIKLLIIVVIVVTVVWSVANVHDYAAHFHNGPMVWTLGLSVGMANAISVYSFVIARTRNVKVAAGVGIALFGVTSGMLQTFLYLVNGAPMLAAIAFGWFGPVAEGVLSWLHASLSEEQEPTRKPSKQASASNSKQVQGGASTQQAQASSKQGPQVKQASGLTLQQVVAMKDQDIADLVQVRRQSVNQWRNHKQGPEYLERKLMDKLPELVSQSTKGKEHA